MAIAILVGREHLSRKGVIAAALILAGAVIIGGGTITGNTLHGAVLIALACLGWGIDNNISQRLSIRDPLQIALLKSVGASVPMLLVAGLTVARFPNPMEVLVILMIVGVGYGLSIWLDLLALRELGAARESVIFFYGTLCWIRFLCTCPQGSTQHQPDRLWRLFVTTTPALWINAIFPSFPRSCLLLIQEILLIIALGYRKRHWEHSLRLHLFCSITNLCLNFARQHFYNEPSRGIANLLL